MQITTESYYMKVEKSVTRQISMIFRHRPVNRSNNILLEYLATVVDDTKVVNRIQTMVLEATNRLQWQMPPTWGRLSCLGFLTKMNGRKFLLFLNLHSWMSGSKDVFHDHSHDACLGKL